MRWLIGIVVVVVIAILGYQYFGARDIDVAEQVEQGAEQAGEAADQAATEAEQATEEAAEATEQAADQAAETAGQAATEAEQAAEATGEAAERAASEAEQATEQAAEATQQAGEQAEETAEQAAAGAEQATEQAAEATEEAADRAAAATEQAADAAQEAAGAAAGAAEEALTEAQTAALTVGDVNVGQQLTDILQNAEQSLQGITDAQSAEAAVPKLNEINTQLEELAGPVGQLPEDAKKVLSDLLRERLAELKTLADDVTGRQGVGEVVRPALEPIIAKLDSWAQQPA
jgi:membrane-associated HD superfamily phosphohydrolase